MPLLRPAILATLVFSFTHAMTAVSAVIFLATAKYNLATVYIIGRVEAGEYPLAIAYSTVLIFFMLAVLLVVQKAVGEARLGRRAANVMATGKLTWTGKPGGVVFERVSKRYGNVTVVDEVSFTVSPGELVTLLGPSGCGKTTTLRMVAGLEPVTSGRIAIGGTDVTLRAANERDVSMVFQSYALFPHMTVLQNVCYGPLSTSSDKAKARELAHAKLEMLGLAGLEDRLPSELSGGQQQRVAVARSLVLEPAVLLFDEPLSNLDAKLRRRVRQEIRDLQQSLVAHGDLRDARPGGGARRLRPHHRDGQRAHRAAGHAARALRDAREPVPGRLHRRCQPRRRRAQGGRGRPDVHRRRRRRCPCARTASRRVPPRSRCGRTGCASPTPGPGSVPGVCKRAAYLGSRIEYMVETPWGELLVFDDEARQPRRRDEPVGVAFDPDAAIVLRR